jgi:hypothetical protein
VENDDEDGDIFFGLMLYLFSFHIGIGGSPIRWILSKLHGKRETSLRVFDWTIWWSVWQDPMYWSSGTPRWRSGNLCLSDLILGPRQYSELIISETEVQIPMPEGCYPANVRMVDASWSRSRWPFPYISRRAVVEVPGGIPFPGKGENAWDCGDDALFGYNTVRSENVGDAIGQVVSTVMDRRIKYGGDRTSELGRRDPADDRCTYGTRYPVRTIS